MFVTEGAQEMYGSLEGRVNNVQVASQPLYANVTPMSDSNLIDLNVHSFSHQLPPVSILLTVLFVLDKRNITIIIQVSRASLGFACAPNWAMAYGHGMPNGAQMTNGHFKRSSQYRFQTGRSSINFNFTTTLFVTDDNFYHVQTLGERLTIRQSAHGLDKSGYLVMDVLMEGDVPTMISEQASC